MYEGRIFVGGAVASLGADAEVREAHGRRSRRTSGSPRTLRDRRRRIDFTKIESGRRLWNFDTKEAELWKDSL